MHGRIEISSDIPSKNLPTPRDPGVKTKPTVLVVQNNPYHSAILWTLLNRNGFQVVSETSGPAARQLARTLRPDAVVLDVNLPELNGLEICRQLKVDPETRFIPVIFYSEQDYLADEAAEVGASAFLAMPTDTVNLPAYLRMILLVQSQANP